MKLELLTTVEDFEAICPQWTTLLPLNPTNEIFLTWQWQFTWWQVYHPGDLWIIAARDDSDALMGIAPWFIEQPSRTVRTIGCVDVTDYLDVLFSPAHADSFFQALADFLSDNRASYDRLDFCNIPACAPLLEKFPGMLMERGFAVSIKQQDVCPTITLPADFEGYLAALDKKQRHELRRKLRRAQEQEADDAVAWYTVGPQHDLSAELEKFITLMAASHPEKANFLTDAKNAAFFRLIMPRLAAFGWLSLNILTINQQPAAAYLNFDYEDRILVYNSGLLPDNHAHLSPGIVLLTYCIEDAIKRGKKAFDFLRGNEEYKYRMGAQDQAVMMFEAVPQN